MRMETGLRRIERHDSRPDPFATPLCTAAGTPGTWMQTRRAAVAVDPSSGTVPAGCLVWNATTGHIKRHAGGYVWEIPAA